MKRRAAVVITMGCFVVAFVCLLYILQSPRESAEDDRSPGRSGPVLGALPVERADVGRLTEISGLEAEPAGLAAESSVATVGIASLGSRKVTIRGTVVNEDGGAIGAAAVELFLIADALVREPTGVQLLASGTTERNGSFLIAAEIPSEVCYPRLVQRVGAVSSSADRVVLGARAPYCARRLIDLQVSGLHSDVGEVVLQPSASITGRVLWSNGLPVESASVSVRASEQSDPLLRLDAQTVSTAADGSFVADDIAAGMSVVEVSAPDVVPLRREVPLESGKTLDCGDLFVERGLAFEGEVVALPARIGVPQAKLILIPSWEVDTVPDGEALQAVATGLLEGLYRKPMITLSTDSDGRFCSYELPAGDYAVACCAEGYEPWMIRQVEVPGSPVSVELREDVATRIRFVSARSGEPMVPSAVTVLEGSRADRPRPATLQDDGSLRLSGSSIKRLVAEFHTGIPVQEFVVDPSARDEGGEVSCLVNSGTMINLSIIGSEGLPLEGIGVVVESERDGYYRDRSRILGATSENGTAHLGPVAAGTWTVWCGGDTHALQRVSIAVAEGVEPSVAMTLRGACTIEGSVEWGNGMPIENATVVLDQNVAKGAIGRSDADGKFVFTELRPGRHNIYVREADLTETLILAEGAVAACRIVVPMPGGVRGSVSSGGGACTNVEVQLTRSASANSSRRIRVAAQSVDTSGVFDFERIAAGEYFLAAVSRDGLVGDWNRVVVDAGKITNALLELPEGVVGGRVADVESGRGIEGATVVVECEDRHSSCVTTTDANGLFSVSYLAAGRAKVVATAAGRGVACHEVSIPAPNVNIALSEEALVSGSAVGADGSFRPGDYAVRLTSSTECGQSVEARLRFGRFVMRGLAAGTYEAQLIRMSRGESVVPREEVLGSTSVKLVAGAREVLTWSIP